MGAYSLAQAQGQLDRLVDEALTGERVTLTRDGRTVVTLTPTPPEPMRWTDEFLLRMLESARERPSLGGDSVALVREMREEDP